MDRGPNREAPHHRVPRNREHAPGPTTRAGRTDQRWVTEKRSDEQDRGQPHKDGPNDPADIARTPQVRRLAPAKAIEIDHQPKSDQRNQRIKAAERPLAHRPDQGTSQEMRKQEMRSDERNSRQEE